MIPSLAGALDYYGVRYRTGCREQKVLCPVHADRDPSMNVNLDEGVFFCHACGARGNGLNLIMLMEGCDADGARTIASSNRIEAVDPKPGSGEVQLGYLPSRRVPRKKGDRGSSKGYTPVWRR